MKYPKIISEIERTRWAITYEAFEGIKKAVESGLTADDYDLFHKSEALSEFDSEKPTIIDDKGLLVINGPIIPRATAFSKASGIVSIDKLTKDFKALEADEKIKEIQLLIDSPGGSITGISDFAQLIKASDKPTAAFVVGEAASAAYWVASAADRIISTDTGLVGSIGVVFRVGSDGEGSIISSQSPDKRPDVKTKEGRAVVQALVDNLADIFVEAVAENRDTTVKDVLANFGKGGLLVASQALEVGMIDGISTINDFMIETKEHKHDYEIEAQEQPRRGNSEIQTLIFKKTNFPTRESAAKWARDHEFKSSPIVEKPDTWHIRQNDPNKYQTFRTGKPLAPGVTPVYGIKRRSTGANAQPAQIAGERNAAMILAELLAEHPAARVEHEALIKAQYSAGFEAGVGQMRSENKKIASFLKIDAYPRKLQEKAVMVLEGNKSFEALESLVDILDVMAEEKKSEEAKAETAEQPAPETVGSNVALSTDGQIRTEADVLAWQAQMSGKDIEVV